MIRIPLFLTFFLLSSHGYGAESFDICINLEEYSAHGQYFPDANTRLCFSESERSKETMTALSELEGGRCLQKIIKRDISSWAKLIVKKQVRLEELKAELGLVKLSKIEENIKNQVYKVILNLDVTYIRRDQLTPPKVITLTERSKYIDHQPRLSAQSHQIRTTHRGVHRCNIFKNLDLLEDSIDIAIEKIKEKIKDLSQLAPQISLDKKLLDSPGA